MNARRASSVEGCRNSEAGMAFAAGSPKCPKSPKDPGVVDGVEIVMANSAH